MCGIAGLFQKSGNAPAPGLLQRMAHTMCRRGPDGEGFYTSGGLSLIHRRLSVIDLENGVQPMVSADGKHVIVFNGEIFNYRELRWELEGRGVVFRTKSDTEVLLELFVRDGLDSLSRLNGFFAFAVYDAEKQELFLARDRMGVKPLYYFFHDSGFAFASTLNALKCMKEFPKEIDHLSLSEYMAFQYVPGNRTIYQNVQQLPPANWMTVSLADGTRGKNGCFWSPGKDIRPFAGTYKDAQEELRSLMMDAVERRLIADVPLGVFLSGGLDSAVVAAAAAQKLQTPLDCYSISFADKAYDESHLAKQTADFLSARSKIPVRFHCRQADPANPGALKILVHEFGEPYADASMLPTCLLSRFTRESVTVALSGDGADELFGGYERYRVMNFSRTFPLPHGLAEKLAVLLPSGGERSRCGRLKRLLKVFALEEDQRYRFLMSHGADALSAKAMKNHILPSAPWYTPVGPDLKWHCAELDLHTYLPGDVLRKVDVSSMAERLEVRSPFLDYRVAEFAMSLPYEWKICGIRRKRIAADAFADLLPAGIATRKKRGFGVPVALWLRTCWNKMLRDYLFSGLLDEFFVRKELENLLLEHESGAEDHSYYLFSLLMLAMHREDDSFRR